MKEEITRIDLGGVNCYLIGNDDSFVLVDTGGPLIMDKTYNNRLEKLERRLGELGCKPDNLNLIILTHGDCDHVANAAYLREKYQTEILMHRDDIKLVDNPTVDLMMDSFKFKSILYKLVFKLMSKKIRKVSEKKLEKFESFRPDIVVDSDYSLSDYGLEGKIFHMPGHTNGSLVILTDKSNLISGDIFSNGKKPDTSPNAVDFEKLEDTVEKLRTLNIKNVYPGHGEPFEMSELK